MSMLSLKAWRDTLAHKGQFIALIVLVSLGIMSFVTFQNGYFDLTRLARRGVQPPALRRPHRAESTAFRSRQRAASSRSPASPSRGCARSRTSASTWAAASRARRASSRFPTTATSTSTTCYVEAGRLPAADARDEVLLHPKFAAETSTEVNDTLTLRIGGERRRRARRGHRLRSRVPLPAAQHGRPAVARRVRRAVRPRARDREPAGARGLGQRRRRAGRPGCRHRAGSSSGSRTNSSRTAS